MSIILKDGSDKLNDGDDQGAKGDGSKMVFEDPLDALSQRALASCVSGVAEVPGGACGGDDELSASDDESGDPEKSKEEVKENVPRVCCPLNGGKGVESVSWSFFTDGENEDG